MFSVNRCLHPIKTVVPKFQIRKNCRMHVFFVCILTPGLIIRLYHDLFYTVQSDNIKFPDRFVIFRWISCCHDHPAFRNLMISEAFALEKLEHCRCQCLRNTVDLINKKNSLVKSSLRHTVIDTRNDLTHRIFRCGIFSAAIFLL